MDIILGVLLWLILLVSVVFLLLTIVPAVCAVVVSQRDYRERCIHVAKTNLDMAQSEAVVNHLVAAGWQAAFDDEGGFRLQSSMPSLVNLDDALNERLKKIMLDTPAVKE